MTLTERTTETWRALLHARRLLPIAGVALPLLVAQAFWNVDAASGVLAGLLLCGGAVAVAPVTFRVCTTNWPGLWGVAAYVAVSLVLGSVFAVWLPRWAGFEDRFLTDPVTLPFVLGIYQAAGWGLGRDVAADLALQAAHERALALERARDHAELLAVRAHLDPHFLFNTLNAIAEWCATDPVVAEAAIVKLSSVLRTVLTAITSPTWPLSQELKLVQDVLALYRIRDPDRFDAVVRTDSATTDPHIPTLLLLPLVENAFIHGPAAGHAGKITVNVTQTSTLLRIEVDNPGPRGEPRAGGHGLAFVRRRLEGLYGPAASFVLASTDAGHTRASVTLPLEPDPKRAMV